MSEFVAEQNAQKGPGVTGWWDKVLPELDDQRRQDLIDAGNNSEISHRTIVTVLNRWGFSVSYAQVGHWRRNYVG